MPVVTLEPAELERAAAVGRARQQRAVSKGFRDAHGYRGARGVELNIEGCTAELALAKWLGVPWDALRASPAEQPRFDVADCQVRSTRHARGRLLVHQGDPDDQPFVLVRAHTLPELELAGWYWGGDAKRAEWWQELSPGRPCYVVPNGALHPVETLYVMPDSDTAGG